MGLRGSSCSRGRENFVLVKGIILLGTQRIGKVGILSLGVRDMGGRGHTPNKDEIPTH